jgi:PII-like signaling protein
MAWPTAVRRFHREKKLTMSRDLPIMLSIVDEEIKLRAIVEEARRQDLAGATVYRGIEGYGASSRIHRKHLLMSADLPVMVSIIDEDEKIRRFLPILEAMVGEGLIAMSDVEVIRYVHREQPQPRTS